MLGAEAAYCALEAELQHYLDTYTSTHDYDEWPRARAQAMSGGRKSII